MNHLAHALLAGDDELLRLGGLMGDFVRGRPDPALPLPLQAGIRLHRAIDSYTDQHPEVVAARALLSPPYRRYAGILLDMWFDHRLARDFPRWSGQPLAGFSLGLRGQLWRQQALLPPDMLRFLRYMEANDLPAGYADPAQIAQALAGLARRLRHDNPLAGAWPVLERLDAPLGAHFEAFFPQLQAFADTWRTGQASFMHDPAPQAPSRA